MILITGAAGFVGQHTLKYMSENLPNLEIGACVRSKDQALVSRFPKVQWFEVDLLNANALNEIIRQAQPTAIIHLASASSVGYSWLHPRESTLNNLNVYLNLLEAVRTHSKHTRVLSVGSSEVYGKVDIKSIPLLETHPIQPISPYGVARASQESLSQVYIDGYGLDIVITRSFNHFGPGQDSRFALPSFAKQIAQSKKKGEPVCRMKVGNVDVIRDFTDVRDVVTAYLKLIEKGNSGQVYNICSGEGRTLREVIEMMALQAKIELELSILPDLVRPQDLPIIIGSNQKLVNELEWRPRISFEATVSELMAEWTSHENSI
jgi:GDP-4-dehydro-6-deoxy-D-mannose reductase